MKSGGGGEVDSMWVKASAKEFAHRSKSFDKVRECHKIDFQPAKPMSTEECEELSVFEQKARAVAQKCFRLAVAVFVSAQMFDFLFNSIWMHGYIWSLNQKVEMDMSERSAGAIVDHQLSKVGNVERLVISAVAALAVCLLLLVLGYARREHTVWELFKHSIIIGTMAGCARCMQMQQRLYPAIHEGFYTYLLTFFVGLTFSIQF
uniref:Transmembrane protein n=2 Tax=Steinernema glaseri TaxID=37863 RepID=A0A1I7ZEM9_9BILA